MNVTLCVNCVKKYVIVCCRAMSNYVLPDRYIITRSVAYIMFTDRVSRLQCYHYSIASSEWFQYCTQVGNEKQVKQVLQLTVIISGWRFSRCEWILRFVHSRVDARRRAACSTQNINQIMLNIHLLVSRTLQKFHPRNSSLYCTLKTKQSHNASAFSATDVVVQPIIVLGLLKTIGGDPVGILVLEHPKI